MIFSGFFRYCGRLGGSSVFEGPPKRNASFLGARRPRKPPKGSPKGGPKTDPEKYTNKSVLGGRFWHQVWKSRALFTHLVTILSPLGPRGPKREAQDQPKSAQETPKSCPREPKRGPREAKRALGEPKRGPRQPQRAPREPKRAQERLKRAQEGPRQAKRAPKETKRGQKSKKRDPKETQRNEEGDTRGQRGGHKREIKKRVARESPSQRETEDPSTIVSRREVEGKPQKPKKEKTQTKSWHQRCLQSFCYLRSRLFSSAGGRERRG